MSDDWRQRASRLADELTAAGDLRDPAWRAVFATVPRHLFVPGHDIDEAYRNEAIVTQTRPAYAAGGDSLELPTSSASAPSAVAVMLDRLNLSDGKRILEIGTGTGYNAALLSARCGDANVASIDIDPELVEAARSRLAELGYRPTLMAGDGHAGISDGAPYDAILATCAVTHIPPSWIGQLTPDGRIVAPLAGGYEAALMVLTKTADDEVTGHFDPALVSFMPLRPKLDNPLVDGGTLDAAAMAMPHYGTTTLDPSPLTDPDPDLVLFLHLHAAGLTIGTSQQANGEPTLTVSDRTASAEVILPPTRPGTWTVTQRGPHRLWDTIEHAARLWEHLGKPTRDRLGISALDRADRQYVWLDEPDGPYSWPMPL